MSEYVNGKYKLTKEQQKVCYGLWKNFIESLDRMEEGETIGIATLNGKYWLKLTKTEQHSPKQRDMEV